MWDGNSLNCCSHQSGNYLRYNNPHKTSLYIVSRLPVIVWSQAAIADFVRKENIGISVDSLEDVKNAIASISQEEYEVMCANVEKIGKRLEKGYYLKKVLASCEAMNE